MYIFDLINNDNYFKPFCSKNRYVYYDCICELIKKSKGRPIFYDDDARDALNIYLSNSKLDYIEETDDITHEQITKTGTDIMRYFRICGWLTEKEMGRSGEYETHVAPYCRRLIEYLQDLAEKNNDGSLSNKIINMYEILKSAFSEESIRSDRPYANILKPLIENMEDLKEELFDLKENIGRIMMMAMDLQNMKGIGDFMLKDDLLEKFFNDYFYIKNNGTIAIVIGTIKDYLRRLNSEEWVSRIATNYSDQKEVTDKTAREFVNNSLMDIRFFITDEYQEYIEQIEEQINNYYSLAHSKIAMFSKSGINIELALDEFLKNINKLSDEEQKRVLSDVSECLLIGSQRYIGTKSFLLRKRKKKEDQPGLEVFDISEEELERMTSEVIQNKNKFSVKEVTGYFNAKFEHTKKIELKDEPILSRYDALMYATALSMTKNTDFNYDVEIMDDVIDFGFVRMSDLRITPKEGGGHEQV